jgi:hypothetical protein
LSLEAKEFIMARMSLSAEKQTRLTPLLSILAAIFCCAPNGPVAPDADAGPSLPAPDQMAPVYFKDIQPLVQRACVSCHKEGGIGPFALESSSQVVMLAQAMNGSIASGRMPPYFASTDCNTYAKDPRWSDAEKKLFQRWIDTGKPLGDPKEAVTFTQPEVMPIRADVSLSPGEPFDIRLMGASDNYQCFVLDPKNTEDVLVTGYRVKPDNAKSVHHVLAYSIPEAQVAEALAKDAATPEVGYPCAAGGVGVQGAVQNLVGSWVPGVGDVRLPAGSGLSLKKNGRIIMQIHYNLAAVNAGERFDDQTSLSLEVATSPTIQTAKIFPALFQKLSIAPNDANSVQSKELPAVFTSQLFGDATIYAVNGHMHLLGKSVRLDVIRADGTSQCLLNIPNYDFNWQQSYELKTPFALKKTDVFKITCTYDNSEANQPTINGVKQMPRMVTWGENTTDEMCMAYMTFVQKP